MLAWMDLEMTGLEPGRHVIVEIATVMTDDELRPIGEGPDLVVHATAEELAEMDDYVVTMHTRSGLLDGNRVIDRVVGGCGRADTGLPASTHR